MEVTATSTYGEVGCLKNLARGIFKEAVSVRDIALKDADPVKRWFKAMPFTDVREFYGYDEAGNHFTLQIYVGHTFTPSTTEESYDARTGETTVIENALNTRNLAEKFDAKYPTYQYDEYREVEHKLGAVNPTGKQATFCSIDGARIFNQRGHLIEEWSER